MSLADVVLDSDEIMYLESSDSNLSGLQAQAKTFEKCIFTNIDFSCSDFSECVLVSVSFIDCDLSQSNFFNCHISDCTFKPYLF